MNYQEWLKNYIKDNLACLNYRKNLKDAYDAGYNAGLKEAVTIMSNGAVARQAG
jgi:hypothetical protein